MQIVCLKQKHKLKKKTNNARVAKMIKITKCDDKAVYAQISQETWDKYVSDKGDLWIDSSEVALGNEIVMFKATQYTPKKIVFDIDGKKVEKDLLHFNFLPQIINGKLVKRELVILFN